MNIQQKNSLDPLKNVGAGVNCISPLLPKHRSIIARSSVPTMALSLFLDMLHLSYVYGLYLPIQWPKCNPEEIALPNTQWSDRKTVTYLQWQLIYLPSSQEFRKHSVHNVAPTNSPISPHCAPHIPEQRPKYILRWDKISNAPLSSQNRERSDWNTFVIW